MAILLVELRSERYRTARVEIARAKRPADARERARLSRRALRTDRSPPRAKGRQRGRGSEPGQAR
ncbi:hypothetical protein, partial [Sorangium cellulosum]|uniref:hypothetical protein n=1 Tax=Sorangium cellulosum TaxID=56 RepID=UPI001F48E68C